MSSKVKIAAAFMLIRPLNILITFLTCIVSSIICFHNGDYKVLILAAAFTAAITAASGNIINDIADIEGDKINHPDRALPSGRITLRTAKILYLFMTIISVIISLKLPLTLILINIFTILLLWLYSEKLKRTGLPGNILISFLTGMVFIFGGLAVNNIYGAFIPALFAFLINIIRELVKDTQDIKGDLNEGIKTFPGKYGLNKTKILVIGLCLSLIIAALLPAVNGVYDHYYSLIIILIFDPVLAYIIFQLIKKDINLSLNNISFLLKLNMVIGLTALYLGK